MRRDIWTVFVLVVASMAGVPFAEAQQDARGGARGAAERVQARGDGAPAPALDPRQAQVKMDQLLQLWEKQSARLRTLDVTIHRVDRAPAWDENEQYEGRAILKSPNLAWLNFDKVVVDAKKQKVRQPYEQIRCTGSEVWQYRSDSRQIFIYPLEKQDRQKALEEGPLPFLFNMRADDARGRYRMQLLKEDDKSYVIGVLPLKPIDQESFSKAFLQLDRRYLLPTRIYLISPDGKSTKDFTLTAIKPNVEVADENFQGKTLPNWKVVRNPDGDGKPAPVQRGARPPMRQPALRGGAAPGLR
jgi:TIGR03009 family protein